METLDLRGEKSEKTLCVFFRRPCVVKYLRDFFKIIILL